MKLTTSGKKYSLRRNAMRAPFSNIEISTEKNLKKRHNDTVIMFLNFFAGTNIKYLAPRANKD